MRRLRKGWVLVIAAAVVIAVTVALVLSRPPIYEVKLPDGSTLRVEKVVYGKRPAYTPGGFLKRMMTGIASHLPRRLADRLVTPPKGITTSWMSGAAVANTNFVGLHFIFTRRAPGGKGYQDVDVYSGELADEDGCIYGSAGAGGEDTGLLPPPPPPGGFTSISPVTGMAVYKPPGTSMNWLSFDSFPRYDGTLRLRAYSREHKVIGEFQLTNPAKLANRPPPKWNPTAIPVAVKEGDLSFILSGLKFKTNKDGAWLVNSPNPLRPGVAPTEIVPAFEAKERGGAVDYWKVVGMELVGGSGNIGARSDTLMFALCPREPAWKLTVKFAGSERSSLASNESWTIKGLKVPGPGERLTLTDEHKLQGVTVRVRGFSGPGVVVYSNEPPARLNPSRTTTAQVDGTLVTATLRSPDAHVAVVLDGLTVDQRFTVRAIDDQQRETYGQEIGVTSWMAARLPAGISYIKREMNPSSAYVTFKLAEDAKTVDLVFCVHATRKEEFVLKPPDVKK